MVAPYEGAANAGLLIDCIWFKNGRFMPAVMEVEHTTGVKSGLMRMLNYSRKLPRFDDTRYAICQRRHLHGITQEFLDCYMEKVVND